MVWRTICSPPFAAAQDHREWKSHKLASLIVHTTQLHERIPRFWKTTKHEKTSLMHHQNFKFYLSCLLLCLCFLFFCLSFPSYVFPWSKVNIRRIWRILNPEQNKHEVNDEIQPEIQRYLRSLRNRVSSIVGVETCSPIYAIMEKRVSVSRSKGSGYEKRSNDSPSTPDTERSSF